MPRLPRGVHRLLAQQHGVISLDQLSSEGLAAASVLRLERSGDLVRVIRGAYATPSVGIGELGRCAAVCLAHPLAAISGPSAARIWGFRRQGADRRIHVIAPRGRRVTIAPWCIAYRTDAIHPEDVVELSDGRRVTSRARTVLDLARLGVSSDGLLSCIEQAMLDGGLRDGDLRRVAVDWERGRPWVRRFLGQLDRRLAGPAAESEPEVRVGQALAAAGVAGLVRQFAVELPGHGRVRFDLAVPMERWACEVDVFPTHRETVGAARDRARDVAAELLDWRTFRISADDYRLRFDSVIAEAVADCRSWRLSATA